MIHRCIYCKEKWVCDQLHSHCPQCLKATYTASPEDLKQFWKLTEGEALTIEDGDLRLFLEMLDNYRIFKINDNKYKVQRIREVKL